jgi:hypothetical protein
MGRRPVNIRYLRMATTAAAIVGGALLLGVAGASAQSSCTGVSVSQCEAYCGDAGVASCTKDPQSEPNCICNEETKDVKGNAYGTATQDTAGGKGNVGNKTEEECTGNKGQCKQQ